ncbi:MAG: hypothetical protein ACD_39C02011G0002, partial [uncultured bacterium]
AEIIREIHREVLPQIVPELIMMRPDRNFGRDIFDAGLPEKILQALRQRALDAILVQVDAPEFEKSYYWHSAELAEQCKEPDQLALSLSFISYINALELYQQRYQKLWYRYGNLPQNIANGFNIDKIRCPFAYLSRYSEMLGSHDRVDEFFTDYFSQQSIYRYTYSSMSSVNYHGAYTVIIPQKSLDPAAILRHALRVTNTGCSVSLSEKSDLQKSFMITSKGADYFIKAPSEFLTHMQFSGNYGSLAGSGKNAGFAIRVSGRHQPALARLAMQYRIFRLFAALLLIVSFASAFYCWLFGFDLRLSARCKLAMILGLIVILPVLGFGSLTFLALRSSERLIESHLIQQTQNNLRDLSLLNEENLLRQMAAGMEIKRRVERDNSSETDLFKIIERPGDDLLWFTTWTNHLSEGLDNGVMNQYSGFRQPAQPNRLVNSLIGKYMDSLGLIRTGKKSDFSRTMTLGMLENYITPELEESWIAHEGTLQRELTHTADTTKANLLVMRNVSGRYRTMYHRVSSIGEHVYRYLSSFAENKPGWFFRRGRYGEVNVGVRLRKVADLFMYAWPSECLLSPDMNFCFERAMATRDHGYSVGKHGRDVEVRAWRYEEGKSAVLAAVGRSDGGKLAFAGLTVNMLFPILVGYSMLLLYFVTSIIVEFISGPVRIINLGVEALDNENYGVLIAGFSTDEFDKVTQAFNEMSVALKQREMIKRYVSGTLIEKVQAADGAVVNDSKVAKVAILASDIRSFTTISEKHSPAEVVDMLNSYFTSMEQAITGHGGVIDKYIGDAVQAVFYDDPALENYVMRACRAAMQMRRNLADLNEMRKEQGLFTIDNGVGIDAGHVVSGSIGSESGRKDFTITGKVIEQAAALESLTVHTESRILISLAASMDARPGLACRAFNSEALELLDV